jgi:hypothetical protein
MNDNMAMTIDDLRREFADVMANQAVSDTTRWVPPNTSPGFSVDGVIAHAKKHASEMHDIIRQIFGDTDE